MFDFLKFGRKRAPALPPVASADVFSYSDVLGEFSVFDFLGVVDNGRFFEMPVSLVDWSGCCAQVCIMPARYTPKSTS